MAFDSARGVAVLFGGSSRIGYLGETWEWNGVDWTLRPVTDPSPRDNHAMAYDSARGRVILYGGYAGGTSYSDTWELNETCTPPLITTQPTDQAAGVDVPISFFVEAAGAPGCTPPPSLTYQWQRRNLAVPDPDAANAWGDLTDGGGFINTHTPALLITRPTPAQATGYRCRITGGCGCGPGENASTYTDTVNFSVACPADFIADGGIDGLDVQAFFERWENGC